MPHATVPEMLRAVAAGRVTAYGMTPSFAALVCAQLATRGGPIVALTADEPAAARLADDLGFFLPDAGDRVLAVPAIDTSAYAELSPDRRALMDRMAALFRLSHGGALARDVIVLSAGSLVRRTIAPAELDALADILIVEQDIDRDATLELLVRAGYARVPVVEDPGTFAVRGGVLDLFPPLYGYPVRLELFGDTIETKLAAIGEHRSQQRDPGSTPVVDRRESFRVIELS